MDEPKTQTKKILLASPNVTLLDRLSRVLREASFTVAATHRSGRLLYRALEDPFDLVVMDLDLEDLNGIEALQILRRAKPVGSDSLVLEKQGQAGGLAASQC